jgi:hypothetical protein
MASSEPRGTGCLRFLLGAVAVFILLVVALFGLVEYQFHRATTPPDVAKTARSAAVAGTDQRAVVMLDSRLTAVLGQAPWLTPAATSIEDRCSSDHGPFFGRYQPPVCTRTVARFVSFDGDLVARGVQWDRALRADGWIVSSGLDASPPAIAAVNSVRADYQDAADVQLSVFWGERPSPPLFNQRGPQIGRSEAEVYLTDQPVDVAATSRELYQRFRYVAVVSVELTYYDASRKPPSPTPTLGNYHPCYSGSGTCVGG